MNLVIDIGNTLLKIACYNKSEMKELKTFQVKDWSFFLSYIDSIKGIKRSIISSVSEKTGDIQKIFLKKGIDFMKLDRRTPLPVLNLYGTKETLGFDRIAAICGASYLFPQKNNLVIDAGTALTFDFLNCMGDYQGGNISPGLQMRYKSLHDYTSNLPLIEKNEQIDLIGNNTHDAINNGVINGIIFEIEGYIEEMKKMYLSLNVVVTGGDAFFFDKFLKNTIFVVANLTLTGLNRILNYNA